MIRDYFSIAVRSLIHRRLRSLLTIIGIFIGIAAVVSLIALGNGLQGAVSAQFEKLGTDKITIMPASTMGANPVSTTSHPLTKEDVKTVQKVQGIKQVGGILMLPATITFKGKTKMVYLIGYPMDDSRQMLEDSQGIEIASGRKPRVDDTTKVAIGSYITDGLFDRKVGINDKIQVNGKNFEVIGTLKSIGSRMDDTTVYMPLDQAREILGQPTLVSIILAQVEPSEPPNKVAEKVKHDLRVKRGEKEGEETFSAQTSEQLASSFGAILAIIQAIIVGIAAISLLVGGIGIMNTMYTSVIERTKEIGIMKAIGATNSDVLYIFLIESGLLGLVGGLIGVLIGGGLAKLAEIIAQQALGNDMFKASLSPELIFGALAFAFVIGAVSGVLPARQAAQLKPVDALRYE